MDRINAVTFVVIYNLIFFAYILKEKEIGFNYCICYGIMCIIFYLDSIYNKIKK